MSVKTDFESSIEKVVSNDASHVKIVGAAGTGKTLSLIRRCEWLLQEGARPTSILVLTSTPTAAIDFKSKLIATKVPGASEVDVTTPHDFWVSVLSTPCAIEATGRTPRILNDAEYNFLLEDMKVTGIKANRLREVLGYIYRELTEMGDDKEKFILGAEEETVYSALQDHLNMRRAMLTYELSNTVVHYLRDLDSDEISALGIDHILVDDYQNLNIASQIAVDMLDSSTLFVSGCENECCASIEPFPNGQGFVDFCTTHENAEEILLSHSLRCPQYVAAAANSLTRAMKSDCVAEFNENTAVGALHVVKWGTPDVEIAGLVDYIQKKIADPDKPLNENDIHVVVPNKWYGNAIAGLLEKKRIKHTDMFFNQPLTGDPRNFEGSRALRFYTALNLLAAPDDVVAWRSWCGFGSYLCNSNPWTSLEKMAAEKNVSPLDVLEEIALRGETPFLEADKLISAYESGMQLIRDNKNKTGFSLLAALDEEVPPTIEILLATIVGDEDAATFFKRASERNLQPVFDLKHGVRIGTFESTHGLSPKLLIIAGLIDGFMPKREAFDINIFYEKRDKIRDGERMRLYSAMAKASDELVLSYFQSEKLSVAEPMKMEIHRIRAGREERMAMLSPSVFIDEMGDALPGPVSALSA